MMSTECEATSDAFGVTFSDLTKAYRDLHVGLRLYDEQYGNETSPRTEEEKKILRKALDEIWALRVRRYREVFEEFVAAERKWLALHDKFYYNNGGIDGILSAVP